MLQRHEIMKLLTEATVADIGRAVEIQRTLRKHTLAAVQEFLDQLFIKLWSEQPQLLPMMFPVWEKACGENSVRKGSTISDLVSQEPVVRFEDHMKAAKEAKNRQPEVVKPVAAEEPLTINDEWKAILAEMNRGSSVGVFVTGPAGTGKSTLLREFINTYDGVCAVVAPTGVSALRVQGETLHRFFGFGAHALTADDIHEVADSRRAKYRALDTLIIDEISMVRADLMDGVDLFLRKNGRSRTQPFGGCRLVMFGDLFQLPPVSKEVDEKKWLTGRYGTDCPFFFHAEVWRNAALKTSQLTTIFRQKDPAFTETLNAIRNGTVTPAHMDLINSRVKPGFRPPDDGELWLTLTTTNNAADQANDKMLSALPGAPRTFEATLSGEFDLKNAPTDQSLKLKAGANVIFIRNNKDAGWVNGTMGKVTSVEPLKVMVNGTEQPVEPETWEQTVYTFDEKTKKLTKEIKGKFVQIPLKLAAAITIHKSQGLSLDRVIVDFANGAFAAGQGYVALSRCRTLEGMILRKPLRDSDLIVSTEVQRFMKGEAIAKPVPSTEQLSLIEAPKP